MRLHNQKRYIHREHGVMALLVSIVLLTLLTFVTIYTSRTVLMEQKIATNDFRGKMAFEAAESGIETAMAYLANGGVDHDGDGNLDIGVYDTSTPPDGIGDTNTTTLVDGSQVTVTISSIAVSDLFVYEIQSTGVSDDNTATRTISTLVAYPNPLPNVPDNPLVTRGSVVIGGSATVFNPEGHSTIWSGGDISLGSSNSTKTEIADPSDAANYPDCLGGSVQCRTVKVSDQGIAGLDIIEYDTNLANLTGDEFFQNFFGASPTQYKAGESIVDIVAANASNDITDNPKGIDNALSNIMWVDGNAALSGGPLVGCNDYSPSTGCSLAGRKPSILIVDGDLSVTGNFEFYGLLYIRGDIKGTGSVNVTGAAVVEGVVGTTSGNLSVTYNGAVLRSLQQVMTPTGNSGTWHDF